MQSLNKREKIKYAQQAKDGELWAMRHSLAHLMAAAVLEQFPGTQLGVGPAIENGFYHDFYFPKGQEFSEKEFEKITKRMAELIAEEQDFVRSEMRVDDAMAFLEKRGQKFTAEIIRDLKVEGEITVSFYQNGDFINLCEGPHVKNTRDINLNAFQLQKIAGAYWKGDETRDMMTRIYGLAFRTPEELKNHLHFLEEAEKRDHRKLGRELDLFIFSDMVGAGLPLWTPRGTVLRNLLDDFVWELRKQYGYKKVTIPHITKKELYEQSGHWEKFQKELFIIITREGHTFAMKPMNCPHHAQLYKRMPRSYRDLPQRYAETTMIYRDEQTGELHGLSRVRSVTQDDAHVFCRQQQVKEEMTKIWNIIDTFYTTLGFADIRVRLSLHDPEHFENYLGTKEVWERAEEELRTLARERRVPVTEAPGEAAFYGPKVDFLANDSLGREWQIATIQADDNQPERFDLTCVNEEGVPESIVMIHAAIMGSIERFLSMLIEHHAGEFPLWLAPVQIALLSVNDTHIPFCEELAHEFESAGLRVDVDDSTETVGKKIRLHVSQKVPYVLVIGDKEVGSATLSVRRRGQQETQTIPKEQFIEHCKKLVTTRSLDL